MGYTFYKGKLDWAEYHGLEKMKGSPGENRLSLSFIRKSFLLHTLSAQQFAYQLDIPRAKVLRFDGFTKIDEFTIENRKDLEEFPELALSVSDKMKDQKILREMKEKAAAGKDKELLEE